MREDVTMEEGNTITSQGNTSPETIPLTLPGKSSCESTGGMVRETVDSSLNNDNELGSQPPTPLEEHTVTIEVEEPDLDGSKADANEGSIPPSPPSISSRSREEMTGSSNDSVASGKRHLVERIGDEQTAKRRRETIQTYRRVRTPLFRRIPSRIPDAAPLYSQITPYLCVNSIGRHTIEDVRGWLAMTVHTLRITVVIKIRNRVGGGLFVLKFYDTEEAISFKCCYNLWTSREGDTWAIDYVSHRAVLCIPQDCIIAQWQLREGGNLHPAYDIDTPRQTVQPSLLQRMGIPLEDRMTNSMQQGSLLSFVQNSASSSTAESSSGARKRRRGKFRRAIQAIQGRPS